MTPALLSGLSRLPFSKMTRRAVGVLLLFTSSMAAAQTNPAALSARRWRQAHERAIIDEFTALLAIPNVSRDRANILLMADADGPAWTDAQIAEAYHCRTQTIEQLRLKTPTM